MKTKTCPYCNKTFTNIDAPRTFHRMITCGNPECMGKRRKELIKKRSDSKVENNIKVGFSNILDHSHIC